jgi:glycosyltransferase involved in cell wall biosynthesis
MEIAMQWFETAPSSALQAIPQSTPPHLVWVSSVNPTTTLDAATWLETTTHLRALGWQVTLICEGQRGEHAARNTPVHCLPRPSIYLLGQALYHLNVLALLLARWHTIDVILFQHSSGLWLLPLGLTRYFSRQKRPLLIMDTRDIDDSHAGKLKVQVRRWVHHAIFALANRLADGQTTITPRMAALLEIPAAHVVGIWPSGVDPERFAQAQTHRRWPTDAEPIQLLYLGIFIPKRNLLPLCQAVVQANAKGMKFQFTLYGNGVERDALQAFAAQSADAVQVLPPVPHAAIPTLLAGAHVGVTSLPHPNNPKYEASSPIKLFEYLAAGLPILSTRNACHTDVVGSGAYAFWAKDATAEELLLALGKLWEERSHLAQLGTEASAAAQRWSWRAAAQKLSAALEQGLAKRTA